MRSLIAIALASASLFAAADTVSIGNADGSEYGCSGLSRFCYNVPNTGALNISFIYTYPGNPYLNNQFVEMNIGDTNYQSAPGMATFGPMVYLPQGDPNCTTTIAGRLSCATQAVGATFPDGSRLDMVMFTRLFTPKICSGRGCGGTRQSWYIQSGSLVMP